MDAMGTKAERFNYSVCNSFEEKILNDQLCYEVDLEKFKNKDNINEQLKHLHGKRKVLGSIPGLGKPFSPKYDCSLHQEESLKRSWMIGEENT